MSGPRYSVNNQLFTAESVDSIYTPQEVRLEGMSWCSRFTLTSESDTWLQINFGTEVNIATIRTAGFDGFNFYIINFRIDIENSIGELEPLTRPNSSDPMV